MPFKWGRVKKHPVLSGPIEQILRPLIFHRHCNMVLEGVKEMWTELPKTGKGKFSFHPPSFYLPHLCDTNITSSLLREEEGEAGEQGQIHLQDVPQG